MTDHTRREQERALTSEGVEQEASYLLARVREGLLAQERLELAAYLGHEGARAAVAESHEPPGDLYLWVKGLGGWGRPTCVRAALAATRCTLPVFEREQPEDRRPEQACAAAEAWLLDPSPATEDLVRDQRERCSEPFLRARYARACEALLQVVGTVWSDDALVDGLPLKVARRLAEELRECGAEVLLRPGEKSPAAAQAVVLTAYPQRTIQAMQVLRRRAGMDLRQAKAAISAGHGDSAPACAANAVRIAADSFWADDGLSEADVRAAIQRELIPWALGIRDPVRKRVARRQLDDPVNPRTDQP